MSSRSLGRFRGHWVIKMGSTSQPLGPVEAMSAAASAKSGAGERALRPLRDALSRGRGARVVKREEAQRLAGGLPGDAEHGSDLRHVAAQDAVSGPQCQVARLHHRTSAVAGLHLLDRDPGMLGNRGQEGREGSLPAEPERSLGWGQIQWQGWLSSCIWAELSSTGAPTRRRT